MHQKSLLSLSLAAALGVFAGPLQAFSLGDIEVHSALNQPFEANIALRSVRSDERDNLQVRLASEAEFERAGLARPFALTNLEFDIVEQNNNVVVRISSNAPIKEPFLDFIVTATAGSGRMLREYTVLLDPPRDGRRSSIDSPASRQQASDTQPSNTVAGTPASYRVRNNDTLWEVAERVRPDSNLSVYQMMMALFVQNPQAFGNNNINNLRADVTLDVPARDVIGRMSATEARQAFNRQTEQWQQNRIASSEPADADETTADNQTSSESLAVETSDTSTDADDETATSDEKADESVPAPDTLTEIEQTGEAENAVVADARLDLVAPNEQMENVGDEISNQGDPALQQMSEQLTFAQETIEAQNQENVDLKARMDKMEEQVDTMRRLLSLKDADMARLQALLAENDGDIDDLAAALQAQENGNNPQDNAVADQPTEADEPAADVSNNAQTPRQRITAILGDYAIPLALGLLLILLLSWLLIRRRQSLHEDDIFDSDVSDYFEADDGGEDMIPPEVTELDQAPVVEETKSTAELLEQADMFVGYADYTQALNTLEQARLQSPDDQQVIYKRLFVLYKLQRTNDFVDQLADIEFAADSEEWQQIVSWGRELDPNHPLFRQTPAAGDTDNQAEEISEQPGTAAAQSQQPEETVSAEYVEAFDTLPGDKSTTDEPDLEFILDEPPAAREDESTETGQASFDGGSDQSENDDKPADDDHTELTETADPTTDIEPISLDISEIESEDTTPTTHSDSETDAPAEDDGLSLDLSDDEQSYLSSDTPGVTPATDSQDDELTLDLSDYDDVDEVETKLDLAAAYIDMDDQEAARGLLNEVISEGNAPQKQRAQTLLNSLN